MKGLNKKSPRECYVCGEKRAIWIIWTQHEAVGGKWACEKHHPSYKKEKKHENQK